MRSLKLTIIIFLCISLCNGSVFGSEEKFISMVCDKLGMLQEELKGEEAVLFPCEDGFATFFKSKDGESDFFVYLYLDYEKLTVKFDVYKAVYYGSAMPGRSLKEIKKLLFSDVGSVVKGELNFSRKK